MCSISTTFLIYIYFFSKYIFTFCIEFLQQALLVKGVVTNDIVGRPTEIRFFYKQEEKQNFVMYFPNFNLTMRDPGNYGELAMITLPKYVQARFVILGKLLRFITFIFIHLLFAILRSYVNIFPF